MAQTNIDEELKFYSEANIRHLEKIAEKIENGTANLAEHDLIEE